MGGRNNIAVEFKPAVMAGHGYQLWLALGMWRTRKSSMRRDEEVDQDDCRNCHTVGLCWSIINHIITEVVTTDDNA